MQQNIQSIRKPWYQTLLSWQELSGLMESQEGAVPDVGKAGKEVPVCAWHQHTGREDVLVDEVAPEQEEAEHVKGDRVHATFLER